MSVIAQCILNMTVGGGEKLVRTLARNPLVPGFRNRVVCFDRIDAFADEFRDAGVPLDLIPRRQCLFDTRVLPPLVRMIRREKIRLLHAHDLSSLLYAAAAGRLTGARVVMTEHSRHYVDEARRRVIEKRFLSWMTDVWITVSPELAEASVKKDGLNPRKVRTIENGVDIDRFAAAAPLPLRRTLDLPEDARLLLVVGRLEKIKGQQHLIQAMVQAMVQALADGKPADGSPPSAPLCAIFAGDGRERTSLENMARDLGVADQVRFLGARNDIPELMASADLLVMPSESEGLPFTLLEAMAAGLPVLATAVGRIPEILAEGRGHTVPPFSPAALAGALAAFQNDPESFRRTAPPARVFVAARYGEDRMRERYGELLAAAMGESGSGAA